jgi:hypothetical protein
MTSIDWNSLMGQAEDGFTLAPPGDYSVVVKEAEAMQYSTGSQGIKVKFSIESGPNAGTVIFNNFVLVPDKPKALGFFFRNMKTLGLDSEFFTKNPTLDQIADTLIGRRVVIVLKHKEYNGEMRHEVAGIKPPIGAQVASGNVTASPTVPSTSSGPSMVPNMTPSASTPPPVPPTI